MAIRSVNANLNLQGNAEKCKISSAFSYNSRLALAPGRCSDRPDLPKRGKYLAGVSPKSNWLPCLMPPKTIPCRCLSSLQPNTACGAARRWASAGARWTLSGGYRHQPQNHREHRERQARVTACERGSCSPRSQPLKRSVNTRRTIKKQIFAAVKYRKYAPFAGLSSRAMSL